MILESSGKLTDEIYAIGLPGLPGYLVLGEKPALFDGGMTFMGPRYLADLRALLGDENRLRFNFLTHSHFDHAGAAPYLKRKIEGLKIAAHRLAAETFTRPNAIELIRSLSRNVEVKNAAAIGGEDVIFSDPRVDIILEEGTEIDLGGGLYFRTIATPGHTRDAVSYYIPEWKALIAGEALGTLNAQGDVHCAFLASYRDFRASQERLAALDVDILMLGHENTLTGEDVPAYIRKSLEQTAAFYARIENYLGEAHGDREAVVQRIHKEDYEEKMSVRQAVRPYLINLAAKVKVVAERK